MFSLTVQICVHNAQHILANAYTLAPLYYESSISKFSLFFPETNFILNAELSHFQKLYPSHLNTKLKTNCSQLTVQEFNLLNTKRSLLYIMNQSVPRSKHFPPRL